MKKKNKTKLTIGISLGIVLLVGLLILITFIYINYNSEIKVVLQESAYNDELGNVSVVYYREPFFKRLFAQQSVTFSPTTAEVGDRVSLKDKTSNLVFCSNVGAYDIMVYWGSKYTDIKFGDLPPFTNLCGTSRTFYFTPKEAGTYTAKTIYYASNDYDFFTEDSLNSVKVIEKQQTCTPNWQCGSYEACSPSGTQTRTCNDLNNCGTSLGKPQTSQSCIYTGGGSGGGDGQNSCIYKVNGECTSTECVTDGSLGKGYETMEKCKGNVEVIKPKPDYLLYGIFGFVTLLFIGVIILFFRRYFKLK